MGWFSELKGAVCVRAYTCAYVCMCVPGDNMYIHVCMSVPINTCVSVHMYASVDRNASFSTILVL